MANRAYLFSSDRPDSWERPDADYYDSRWTIPLAWFFFYQPGDICLIDVHSNGSHWQEVKFSTEKQTALALFAARESLLLSLVEDRISREAIAEFVAAIQKWRGRFLLLDPDEVLAVLSEDDAVHAGRFARILTILGAGEGMGEAVREAAHPYVGNFSPDQDRDFCQVIGYTYGLGVINETIDSMWTCPMCRAEVDAGFEVCWQCGTTAEGVEDPSFEPEIDAALQPLQPRKRTLITSFYPISKVCPACGEARHKKIKPDAWIAFVADRLCRSCRCRYTPPTPVWASLCFLAIGSIGFIGSLPSVLIVLTQFNILAFLTNSAALVISLLCVAYGLRNLWLGRTVQPKE